MLFWRNIMDDRNGGSYHILFFPRYVPGVYLVRPGFVPGLYLVCSWYVLGSYPVCSRYVPGTFPVRSTPAKSCFSKKRLFGIMSRLFLSDSLVLSPIGADRFNTEGITVGEKA